LPVTIRGGSHVWPQGLKYPKFFKNVEVIFHPLFVLDEKPEGIDLDTHLDRLNSNLKKAIDDAL